MGDLGLEGGKPVMFVAEDGSREWRASVSKVASQSHKWQLKVALPEEGNG